MAGSSRRGGHGSLNEKYQPGAQPSLTQGKPPPVLQSSGFQQQNHWGVGESLVNLYCYVVISVTITWL